MSVNALSGHGTIIARQATPGGAFTDIAELGDISGLGMTRNEFDATTQNEDIDSYVTGVLRRDPAVIMMNFIPTNTTQDIVVGLQKHMIDNVMTGYRFTFPDVAATQWIASGQITGFKVNAPVDGLMTAEATIRFSSLMKIGATTVGT